MKKSRMKITAVFACGILCVTLLCSCGKPKDQKILDEETVEQIRTANESLPVMLDDDTRLERIEGGPGNRMTYHCTLVKYSSEQLPKELFDKEIAPIIKKNNLSNYSLLTYFRKGITVIYSYKGNDGVHISDVVLDPGNRY